ncbi:MAG TPA: hypothetical protein VK151_02195 [Fluviicola sp.]|nr:hypothetical protein [Fluviicola sp.]
MKKLLLFFALSLTINAFSQTFSADQQVLIEWEGKWYPGKILEVKEDGYLISYTDFDASWNEVVNADRLQAMASEETPATPEPTKNSDSFDEKVKAMCECQQQAAASGKLSDKERCLDLKDAHTASFNDDAEQIGLYKAAIYDCKPGANPEAASSYDSMVKEVCDCFEKSKTGAVQRFECFKLQGTHAGKFDDDESKRFLMETNSCDN